MEHKVVVSQKQSPSWTIVGVVAFALFLDYFLYGMLVPLTSLSPAGVSSEDQLGLLYGAYALSVLIITPLFGYLGDRLGGRLTMFCGVVFGTCATAFSGLAPNFHMLLAARTCEGAASAATWTAGLALIAEHYPEKRVEMLGYAFTGSTAGSITGPLLGGVLYRAGGYHLPFMAGGLLFAIEAGLLLFLPRSAKASREQIDYWALLSNRSVVSAAIAVTLAAFAWGIIEPLLPLHLSRHGATAETIGLLFTVSSVAYGLSGRLVGVVSKRLDVKKVTAIGTFAMAVTLPSLSLFSTVILIGAVFCLVNVAYAFMLNPASAELADAVDRSGMSCYSAVYAIYNVAYSIGMIATTAIATQAASLLGFRGALLSVSAVLILAIVLAGLGNASRPAIAEELVARQP